MSRVERGETKAARIMGAPRAIDGALPRGEGSMLARVAKIRLPGALLLAVAIG